MTDGFLCGRASRSRMRVCFAGGASKSQRRIQDLVTLWKDADPDIPILMAAKAKYAKLK